MKFTVIFVFLFITATIQAKTCLEGSYQVQGHSRQAYYKSDGVHVSATTVSSYCRNYRDDGPLKQEFLKKAPRGWPHKKEKIKKCSVAKRQIISKILSSIPKILSTVGKIKIYCGDKSETPNNPGTSFSQSKIIVLYDSSFKMDTKRVIIHELAHFLYSALSDKERESFLKASKWIDIEGIYVSNSTSFSSPDGKLGPEEDFANSIEYYFSGPKSFKNNFPKINFWIKKFIGESK